MGRFVVLFCQSKEEEKNIMGNDTENKIHNKPETLVVCRKISGTTYLVRIHINPDSKEILQDKLLRMIANEVCNFCHGA